MMPVSKPNSMPPSAPNVKMNALLSGKRVETPRPTSRSTPERPRLVVTRSNRHMVAQVVDDTKGITLVSEIGRASCRERV